MGQIVGCKEDLQAFNDLGANLIYSVFQMDPYYLLVIIIISLSHLCIWPQKSYFLAKRLAVFE